jgi:hypothetical protein
MKIRRRTAPLAIRPRLHAKTDVIEVRERLSNRMNCRAQGLHLSPFVPNDDPSRSAAKLTSFCGSWRRKRCHDCLPRSGNAIIRRFQAPRRGFDFLLPQERRLVWLPRPQRRRIADDVDRGTGGTNPDDLNKGSEMGE